MGSLHRGSSHLIRQFPPEVQRELRYYVYAYVDPRDEKVFYVGKGTGNRAFEHLGDGKETAKKQRITEIQEAGKEVRIDILVYGLTEAEALQVEAVCIDLIGLDQLTNLVTGHQSDWGGRRPAGALVQELEAEPVTVEEPALAINIAQTFHYGISSRDLYDMTRGVWRLNRNRASRLDLVLAVHDRIIRAAYRPETWHPAGTTDYARREIDPEKAEGRWEFTGAMAAEEKREKYVGCRPENISFSQNPIRYVNDGW